jgi:hypothetical protein
MICALTNQQREKDDNFVIGFLVGVKFQGTGAVRKSEVRLVSLLPLPEFRVDEPAGGETWLPPDCVSAEQAPRASSTAKLGMSRLRMRVSLYLGIGTNDNSFNSELTF